MSLRRKIVLLFLGLAVLPMLTVATFGFIYAEWLAESVTRNRLSDTALRVANEVEAASTRIEGALARLDRSHEDAVGDGGSLSARLGALEPALVTAAYIEFRESDGTLVYASGARPAGAVRCDPSGGSRLVPIRSSSPGPEGGIVEAGFWTSDLLPPDLKGSTPVRVVDRSTGRTFYSPRCEDLTGAESPAMAAALDALGDVPNKGERFRFRDSQGEVSLGDIRVSPDHQWAAVASANVHGITAPLSRLEAWYWIFILMLAGSTVAAFSLLLGRVTQSLKELTRAAERIGSGDLQPWLPPPGNDEVGRLTLAFSEMLDRVRRMMAHVDHNGRLAVVGQLSSYLAHEIRNPLSSIKMNLQRLDRNVRTGHVPADCADAVEISLKEVDRLASSVTSILQLGRSEQGPGEVVSLHEVVEEAAELLRGELARSRIELEIELDAAADRVIAVPGQMKGVFLNLMMNALEAQPRGGRLCISSDLGTSKSGEPVVEIHLRDFGVGVPASVRDRIFEPFFTTKATGSGIGLAVVARTLHESGGDIQLEDLPVAEQGAEFVVTLPLAAVAQDPPSWRRSAGTWKAERNSERRPRPEQPADAEPPEVSAEGDPSEPEPPSVILPSEASEALAAWVKDRGRMH